MSLATKWGTLSQKENSNSGNFTKTAPLFFGFLFLVHFRHRHITMHTQGVSSTLLWSLISLVTLPAVDSFTNRRFLSASSFVEFRSGWGAMTTDQTDVQPLNLVPAIDIYAKVPPTKFDAGSLQPGSAVEKWAVERSSSGSDPFKLVAQELAPFSDNIKVVLKPQKTSFDLSSRIWCQVFTVTTQELVEADHPILSSAAKHFFEQRHGKRFRPTIVMLMGMLLSSLLWPMRDTDSSWQTFSLRKSTAFFDLYLSQSDSWNHVKYRNRRVCKASSTWPDNRNDPRRKVNSQLWHFVRYFSSHEYFLLLFSFDSLIHDDVLDEADTRRGGDAVHKMYSNKVFGDVILPVLTLKSKICFLSICPTLGCGAGWRLSSCACFSFTR